MYRRSWSDENHLSKVVPTQSRSYAPIRFPRVPDSLSCGEAMPSADADARGSRRMCGSVAMAV